MYLPRKNSTAGPIYIHRLTIESNIRRWQVQTLQISDMNVNQLTGNNMFSVTNY